MRASGRGSPAKVPGGRDKMVFLVLAVLVVATTAATVWMAGSAIRRKDDPDATFWYTFTGLCMVMPMILIPAMKTPALSGALVLVAAATAVGTHFYARRHARHTAANKRDFALISALNETSAWHESLLVQWSRYEWDPAAAIDFPDMSDVGVPETAALIRAVAVAGRLSPAPSSEPLTEQQIGPYQQAVAQLAAALERAEAAAQHSSY
ncbi:hypothetical protein [Arthrobacter sp. lap29]|nr:hypothetical protein [Arthrobacter sp. lap29]